METKPSFVRADGVVILYPVTPLDPDVTVIVLPANPETHDSVWLCDTSQNLMLMVFLFIRDIFKNIFR